MARFFVYIEEGSMSKSQEKKEVHTEGELYREIKLYGRTFTLYYGYYEECDRQNPLCKPIVIYPDFLREPVYTDNGEPFVTMVQDACRSYRGEMKRTQDTTCYECKYFQRGEDWIGICTHPKHRKLEQLNLI